MTRMTTDYDSVLANARISAIMLDGDLRIRSFSREVVRVFNLIDKDEQPNFAPPWRDRR